MYIKFIYYYVKKITETYVCTDYYTHLRKYWPFDIILCKIFLKPPTPKKTFWGHLNERRSTNVLYLELIFPKKTLSY